jgi:hypothetical protein
VAATLNSRGPAEQQEALRLTQRALADEPNYVLDSYRKEQLWGERLRAATLTLLARPELKPTVDRANANAGKGKAEDTP